MSQVVRLLRLPALVAVTLGSFLGAASSARSAEPEASESKLSVSYDATLASKYLFQGLDYSEGRAVMQPNLSLGLGAFSFGAWGNVQPDLEVLNEVDLSLKLSREFGRWSVSPGYMYLRYPNRDWDPSQELFVDLGWDAPLHPTLSVHYDFDAGKGTYSTLGISHEVKAPLTLAANLFHQGTYYEMTGFPALEVKASAAMSAGSVTVTTSLSRFLTWENGDFADEASVSSSWLLAFNLAHQLR